MVDASKRAASTDVCLSNSNVILPQPFPEEELIDLIPLIRDNIASNLDVAVNSTTRAEFPGIENWMLSLGNVREGNSLTGSSGTNVIPANAMQRNTIIIENDDILGVLLTGDLFYDCRFITICYKLQSLCIIKHIT